MDVNSGAYNAFTNSGRICCSCEPRGGPPTTPPKSSTPTITTPPPAPQAQQLSDKELLGYISLDKGPGTDKDGSVTVRAVVTIDGAPPVLSNEQLISVVLAFNNCTTVPWYIREQQPAESGELPIINPALSGRLNGRRRRALLAEGDCATRKEFIVDGAEDCSAKCDKRASDKTLNVGSTYTADTILSEYNGNTCCKCRYTKEAGDVTTASTDEEAEISSADEDDYDYEEETDSGDAPTPSDSSSDSTSKAATTSAAPTSPAVSSTATGVHFFADSTIIDGQVRDVLLFLRQCVSQGSFQQWLEAGNIPVTSVDLLYSGVGDIILGASSGMDPLFGAGAVPPPDSSDDGGGDSLSLGAIIGITVGVACAAIIVAAIAVFVSSKKRRRNKDINSELLTHRWRLERELAESQRAKYANSRNMTLEDLERQRTLRRSQTANAHKNYTSGSVDVSSGGDGAGTTPQSSKSMSRLDSMRSALGLGGGSTSSRGGTTPPPVGGYGVTASSGGGDLGLARTSPPADSPADTQLVGHVDLSNNDIESGQNSKKQKKFGRRLF